MEILSIPKLMCSDCQEIIEINGEIGEFKTISHKCSKNTKIEYKTIVKKPWCGLQCAGCRDCR